jgi:hypothetical protein
MLRGYKDFTAALRKAGFSLAGGSPKGIYSVVPFSWEEQPYIGDSPIRWHTEDPETDPWEWRMRVLAEEEDIAYAKLFFRIGGYITKEWYADFLACRRGGMEFEDAWAEGSISFAAKRIWEAVQAGGSPLLPELKALAGFGREENGAFEQALTELQMRMFLTICGQGRRRNKYGEEYGWHCTRFCTPERFWGGDFVAAAGEIDPAEAEARITRRVLELNPEAKKATIRRFIYG